MSLVNKKTTEQSIRPITTELIMKSFKGDTKFDLTVGELRTVLQSCDMLKDMSAIPYDDSKKLQKNISNINFALSPLQEEANLIEERRGDINDRAMKATTDEQISDLKKDRKANSDETQKFNSKKHKIELFTFPEENFVKKDEDREKFGVKKINQGNGQPPMEVDRYPYFLELLGLGIITEKTEK